MRPSQPTGYTMELLLAAGALDVVIIPAQMKKNRPGIVLQAVVGSEKREELSGYFVPRKPPCSAPVFTPAERRVQKLGMDSREYAVGHRPHQGRRAGLRARV